LPTDKERLAAAIDQLTRTRQTMHFVIVTSSVDCNFNIPELPVISTYYRTVPADLSTDNKLSGPTKRFIF